MKLEHDKLCIKIITLDVIYNFTVKILLGSQHIIVSSCILKFEILNLIYDIILLQHLISVHTWELKHNIAM
jgi:hypothetical protein